MPDLIAKKKINKLIKFPTGLNDLKIKSDYLNGGNLKTKYFSE